MRRRKIRKAIIWLAPGCLLWLSCPAGTGQFLAPILQPVLGQVFADVGGAISDTLVAAIQTP